MKRFILTIACCCGLASTLPAAAAIDGTPPSVSITAPGAGASVTGVVPISVRASDASGVRNVAIAIDGAPVASADGVTTLDFSWDTTQGAEGRSHTITADAYDTAWNHGHTQITVNVPDLQAPTVSILGIPNGISVTGTTNVSLSASDAVGVTRLVLSIDGQVVSDQSNVPTFTYAWDTSALPELSAHTLTADGYDAAGNRGTQSVTVSIRDVSSPVVTYATPSTATVTTDTVQVDVHASDVSGIRSLVLSVDGRIVAEKSNGDSLKYSWNASEEPSGTRHTIATDAYDQIGHRSSASRQITITDIQPPSVSIPRPRSGPSVYGLEMVEVAAADNKTVKHLALSIDGAVVQEASDSTGFIYLWETAGKAVGSKPVVRVSAEDAAGNQAVASRSFTVEAEPPGTTGSPLGIPAGSPDGDEAGVAANFADARNRGAQVLYWYLNWANAAANPAAVDALMAHLGAGGATAITFDLIHSTVLSTFPAPFHAFTDPGFAETFSDYAANFAARYAPTYLFVGNEANLYLESHPDEVAAFEQVIRRTREKVKATGVATRVGVTVNYAGQMSDSERQLLRSLADEAELIGYTAYGYRVVDSAIRFDDPAGAILMLEDLPKLYPGKPFAVVETGWNTSARFASSEALQTEFVRLLRHYADRSPAQFIDIFLLQDGVDCTQQALSFSPPGSNPDPNSPEVQDLAEYLCRFGLRRSDGTGKGAWDYLAQTSWPVPEPSAAGGAVAALACLALLGRRPRY